jgi:hypothetical protein
VVFEAVKNRLPPGFSFEQFSTKLARFSFISVSVKGQVVGAIMADGPEVHVAVLPNANGRWFNRGILNWLNERLSVFGKLVTKVMDDHSIGHAFAIRLGFHVVRKEGGMTFYEKGLA